MRRFNFMIEEELDELLERQARREGISKGALVRRAIREGLDGAAPGNESLLELSGIGTSDSPHEHHDDVIYGR